MLFFDVDFLVRKNYSAAKHNLSINLKRQQINYNKHEVLFIQDCEATKFVNFISIK